MKPEYLPTPEQSGPAVASSDLLGGTSAFVHFDGWGRFATADGTFGRMECARIIEATPKLYRVEFLEDWPRDDKGDIVLVPKWAVTASVPPNGEFRRTDPPLKP